MKNSRVKRSAKQEAEKMKEEVVQLTSVERTGVLTALTEKAKVEKLIQEITADILKARALPEDTLVDVVDPQQGVVRFRTQLPPNAVVPPPGAADESIADKVVAFRKGQAEPKKED